MESQHPAAVPYEQILHEQLREDPSLVAEYLKQAIEDEDPRTFQTALKDVIDGLGLDINQLAEKNHLNHSSLSNLLSGKGELPFETVRTILDALGYRLTLEAKDKGFKP